MGVGEAVLGGSVVGGLFSNQAADTAASAQERGQDIQWRIYQQQRQDYAPYRQIGASALQQLGAMYGLGTTVPTAQEQPQQQGLGTLGQGRVPIYAPNMTTDSGGTMNIGPRRIIGYTGGQGGQAQPRRLGDILSGGFPGGSSGGYPVGTPEAEYRRTIQPFPEEGPLPKASQEEEGPLSGASQEAAGPDYSSFYQSPGYQFRQEEAQRAIERAAAARGGRLSGGTLAALQQRSQDIASQEFGNYWNRMAGLAGIGQAATGSLAQLGSQYGQSAANAAAAAGQYQAAGQLGMGQAIGGGLTGLAQLYGSGQLGSSSMPAGFTGGGMPSTLGYLGRGY